MASPRHQEPITQHELREAIQLRSELKVTTERLAERLADGAYVESGDLDLEGEQIVPQSFRRELDRFRLLARIIDTSEILFTAPYANVYRNLRKGRVRIFRSELRRILSETLDSYQTRRQRLIAARAWHTYPGLVYSTSRTLLSLSKLFAASVLFRWSLPGWINVGRNTSQVFNYLSVELLCPKPGS